VQWLAKKTRQGKEELAIKTRQGMQWLAKKTARANSGWLKRQTGPTVAG
jgi:hypothetical protein